MNSKEEEKGIMTKTLCPFHDCAPTYVRKVIQEAKTQDITLADGSSVKYNLPELVEHKLFCKKCSEEMSGYEKDSKHKRQLGMGCVSITSSRQHDINCIASVNEAWDNLCSDITVAVFKRAVESGI